MTRLTGWLEVQGQVQQRRTMIDVCQCDDERGREAAAGRRPRLGGGGEGGLETMDIGFFFFGRSSASHVVRIKCIWEV